jgi:hypothetical protein
MPRSWGRIEKLALVVMGLFIAVGLELLNGRTHRNRNTAATRR